MEVYILKSVACLALLFAFYKLVLENTSLHTTKRFFLLGSVVVSILIPFITFTEYVEVTPIVADNLILNSDFQAVSVNETETSTNYLPFLLAAVYGIGVLLFSVRFGRNIWRILKNAYQHPAIKKTSILHVLLNFPVTPHSFFNYIFFNKAKYETGEIPNEVVAHETAHVVQKHSWDIVFFELFRIVFWFNPLFYFIKKSIKLNHEFMADRAVLNQGADPTTYQNILLDFSSGSNVQQLAHSINYSSIKKRFTVMKTRTSKRTAWLKGFLILPLLAILIYGFSETKQEFETTQTIEKASDEIVIAENLRIYINETGGILVNEKLTDFDNLSETLELFNSSLSFTEKSSNVVAHIYAADDIPMNYVFEINEKLRRYGISRFINHPTAAEVYNENSTLMISNEKEIDIIIRQSKVLINNKEVPIMEFANTLNKITMGWNQEQLLNCHLNILVKDANPLFVEKLEFEYKHTTLYATKQKKLLPPPPPPPPAPKVIKGINDGDSNVPPPPPPPAPDAPTVIKGVNDGDTNIPPPPPPPPVRPLEHVVKMAKKNATFYYEGKQITSDKAIEIIKKNNDLNIQTTGSSSKNPQVKISTKPISAKTNKKTGASNIPPAPSSNSKTTFKSISLKMTLFDPPSFGPLTDIQDPEVLLDLMLQHNAPLFFSDSIIDKKAALVLFKTYSTVEIVIKDTPHDLPSVVFSSHKKR